MFKKRDNQLERLLRKAANNPSYRPDFYKLLLESNIFIVGQSDSAAKGKRLAKIGEKASILNWKREDGSPLIPFFCSLNALNKAFPKGANYISLPARAFFEMTKGANLILNPKSDNGKEFFPDEIEALLKSGVNKLPERRITQKRTEVILGQPANYPTDMANSLKTLFGKRENVKAVYLALMHDPTLDEKPHLIIGIDADGDVEQIIKEAGIIASDLSPEGEPVDLTPIKDVGSGINQYFINEVKPFYKRKI